MARDNNFEYTDHYEHSKRHHHKVRRECDVDNISKKYVLVQGPSLKFVEEADLPAETNDHDPFQIGSSSTKYSLNKKKRWMIAEQLASTIADYQDNFGNVQVSLLKKVIHDSRWSRDKKNWVEKAYDKEYVSVENDEEVHKHSKHANSYDLLRKPGLPKKKKRKNNTPTSNNISDSTDELPPASVHILYQTAVTNFDKRIANKIDKSTTKNRRKERKIHAKPSHDILTHDLYYEHDYDYETDYGSVNDNEETVDYNKPFNRTLVFDMDFETKTPLKKVHQKKKKQMQKETVDDDDWELLPQDDLFAQDNENADDNMNDGSDSTSEDGWNREISNWMLEALPYIEKRLYPYSSVENYIFWYCGDAAKVNGLYPTTYICFTGKYSDVIRREFGSLDALVFLREGTNKEDEAVVRWVCNKRTSIPGHQLPQIMYRKAPYHPAAYSPTPSFSQSTPFNQYFEQSSYETSEEEERTTSTDIRMPNKSMCEICMAETGNKFALECRHFFCETCWIVSTREAMRMGKVPITCMHVGCTVTLTALQMSTYMPMAVCERYTYLLGKNWIRCDTCGQTITYPLSSHEMFVVCGTCKSAWCLRCKNRAHHPLPCTFVSFYREFMHSIDKGDDARRRFTVQAKVCPNCSNCYNRFTGCKHMTCPCGTQFCDDCGKIFDPNVGFSHKCDKEESEEFEQQFFMFDVIRKYPKMEKFYVNIFHRYREERRPEAINRARRAIVSAKLDSTYIYPYIAALEVLELSGVYLTLCKHHLSYLWERRGGSRKQGDSKAITRRHIFNCHDRLTFAVRHFQDALHSNTDQITLLHLIKQIEMHLRRMMQIGYNRYK